MALVSPIADSGCPWLKNLFHKGTPSASAISEEYLAGNAAVEVKAYVDLRFFGALLVIGPVHGKDSGDQ